MDEQNEVTVEPEVGAEGGDPEEASDEGEEKVENKLAKMREEMSVCRKEKQEYMDGWQRSKADYVNLLKRIEADARASELRGKVGTVETLLPAFDALERAKEHGEVPEGFRAITKQLEGAFASLGLEELGKVGERFNPALHEALGTDEAKSVAEDDMITAVLEKGWKIGGNVIRPAKVRVARHA